MFTGIVQGIGEVLAAQPRGHDLRLEVDSGGLDLSDLARGGSISVDGACLTAVERGPSSFAADVSAETLSRTTAGELRAGDRVNLEKPLTPGTPLGGHLVSGHVDGVGTVEDRLPDGQSVRFAIRAPDTLARYIAEKGSICVDGVSLTVNAVRGALFEVNIVPHTLAATTFGALGTDHRVNLEVDLLARYLERLLLAREAP